MITYLTRRVLLAPVILLGVAGCSDSPLTPQQLVAQQRSYEMDEHAMLQRIMTKLDSFEVRAEREKNLIFARLDSMRTMALVLAAMPPNGPPDSVGNGLAAAIAVVSARTDSIMGLTDHLARESAAVLTGEGICGSLGIKGTLALKSEAEARGEGKGTVGAVALETGASAWLALKTGLKAELAGEGEVGVTGEVCYRPLNHGVLATLPVRPAASAAFFAANSTASSAQLEATLSNLRNQLAINEQSIENAIRNGTAIVRSGDFSQFRNLATLVPLSNTAFTDPLATVRNRISAIDPIGMLCSASSNFPGRIGTAVTDGCGFVQAGNVANIGQHLQLADNFAAFKGKFSTLCGRFNEVVDRRLIVDSNLPWSGSSLNVALFPSSWKVSC